MNGMPAFGLSIATFAIGMLALSSCSHVNSLPTALAPSAHKTLVIQPGVKDSDLLYVADQDTNDVSVYSWPNGKLERTLTGFNGASNLCSDSSGNVYVPNYLSHDILEYAHGDSAPIRTLKAPGENPYGCAVDPATGDLAVANITSATSGPGDLLVFAKAKGKPKEYTDSQVTSFTSCGYDNSGNLFVDGYNANSSYAAKFAELRKGSSSLINVMLNRPISNPGGVLWDGKYVTLGDAGSGKIYEVSVSGSKGTIKGTTTLKKGDNVYQYWFYGGTVIATTIISFTNRSGFVGVWKYPGAGKPIAAITGFEKPDGVTISLAKQ